MMGDWLCFQEDLINDLGNQRVKADADDDEESDILHAMASVTPTVDASLYQYQ